MKSPIRIMLNVQFLLPDLTIFIENASKILPNADRKYTEELTDCCKDIWLPQARAPGCLLFGYHGLVDIIPLQLSEYERFKRLYQDETHDQCLLPALSCLVDDIINQEAAS